MKRFITVLMSAMIALSMMPSMAFAAISASNSVDIYTAISFLKNNLYNSSSLTASTTYSVDSAATKINNLKKYYYVKVATTDENVTSIECGNNTFGVDSMFKLSVGNNIFIEDKAFYVEEDNLYVATVLVAPCNTILVNEKSLDLNLSPTTTSLTASKMEKWNSGGDLTVTRGEGSSCTIEASGNKVTGALYIGIKGADSNTMFITEKTYKNGSTTYGLTGTDRQGEEYGLAFYPFGWGTDLTSPSEVTAYDGNSLDYSIYAVGLGVCNATINYKVGGVKAEVNGVKYTSLGAAVDAVEDGQTITLLNDVTNGSPLEIDNAKKFTIDLNGKIISGSSIKLHRGDVTIKNGTLNVTSNIYANSSDAEYNSITYEDSVVIRDVSYGIIARECANGADNYGTTINFHGSLENVIAGIWVMGNIHTNINNSENPITINVDGTVTGKPNEETIGIALNGAAVLNISDGAAVTGSTGVEVRAGKLNVSGGVITGTDIPTDVSSNGNGTATTGVGIAVAQHTTALPTSVSVKAGTIKGYTGLLVTNPENRGNADKVSVVVEGGNFTTINDGKNSISKEENAKDMSLSVKGGVFSSNPMAYVADGTNIYHQKTGKYFVGSMPASTSGYNAWALQNGIYEETYVAPAEPETPDAPVIDNSGSGDNASTNVDASGSTVVTDGKAETSINSATGKEIVDKAVENKSIEVVIKAETEKGDSTGSTVALPESTVQALAGDDVQASVTIKTDNATVTLDKDAVKATAEQAGTDGEVKLEVVTVENTEDTLKVELKLVTSKGTVSDFKGGNVTVTVPVDPELAKKDIVCVYIDDNGKYTKMEGSLSSDGKSYTFTTGHFSTYAILEEADADAEIIKQTVKVGTANVKLYTYKGGKLRVKASAKNATGYKVYYKKSTWKNYKTYTKGNIKTLDKTFKKLSKGKYTVKVKAYYKDYAGTKVVVTGATSKAKTITVKK